MSVAHPLMKQFRMRATTRAGRVDGQPPDPLAPGLPNPVVDRGRTAAVLLAKSPNPGTVRGDDFGGVVGAAIVDHDDFKVLIGLGEDGFERLAKELATVVDGNDDGHPRRWG